MNVVGNVGGVDCAIATLQTKRIIPNFQYIHYPLSFMRVAIAGLSKVLPFLIGNPIGRATEEMIVFPLSNSFFISLVQSSIEYDSGSTMLIDISFLLIDK